MPLCDLMHWCSLFCPFLLFEMGVTLSHFTHRVTALGPVQQSALEGTEVPLRRGTVCPHESPFLAGAGSLFSYNQRDLQFPGSFSWLFRDSLHRFSISSRHLHLSLDGFCECLNTNLSLIRNFSCIQEKSFPWFHQALSLSSVPFPFFHGLGFLKRFLHSLSLFSFSFSLYSGQHDFRFD